MHVHGTNLNIQATSLGAADSARAENAEKAAETRRRLRKPAETVSDPSAESSDSSAGFLVGEWLIVRHNHALAEDKFTRNGRNS